MRKTYNKLHRKLLGEDKLEDELTPQPQWVEKKLSELEDGQVKVDSFADMVSLADCGESAVIFGLDFDTRGGITSRRAVSENGIQIIWCCFVSPSDHGGLREEAS